MNDYLNNVITSYSIHYTKLYESLAVAMEIPFIDQLVYLIDLFGTAVFAFSGVLVAGRLRMDAIGVIVLAAVTAIGGGTIRDILIGARPLFWIV